MATVILLALFVLMWVVLIVPRQRELKRHTRLLAELAVGDEVMTGAGIYGVVRAIDGEYVRLEVAEGVELKVAKRAVMAKVPTEAEPEEGEVVTHRLGPFKGRDTWEYEDWAYEDHPGLEWGDGDDEDDEGAGTPVASGPAALDRTGDDGADDAAADTADDTEGDSPLGGDDTRPDAA